MTTLGNELLVDICRLCGNERDNRLHHAREMFTGTRVPFTYVECAACGTLQIRDVPDLRPYYSGDYYSFNPVPDPRQDSEVGFKKRLARLAAAAVRRRAAAYYCDRRLPFGEIRHPAGRLFATYMRRLVVGFPDYLKETNLPLGLGLKSAVLDVGSGAGATLLSLSHFGFRDLTGIDPFIESSIVYPNGTRVLKAELSELDRQFDLILANHSIEHVPDPRRTLREIHRLLKPGRYSVVRVPVVGRAWREYRVNWVQLDPPRHLFLFHARTFKVLAEEEGFSVDEVAYDSTAFQFWGSEQYARDIPLSDSRSYFLNPARSPFTEEQIADFAARAAALNARGEGDQAVFYLRRL
ncbi:MAG TPA: class I SAM-dependent methyltransferase [Pyrinomonadaceae bacterium]|nr:class I SAM-dependent methyltransferase [Pyrinomonadaceae bacterium]